MSSDGSIFQCELCNGQFDAAGVRVAFRICTPVPMVCEVCKVNPPKPEPQSARPQGAITTQGTRTQKGFQGKGMNGGSYRRPGSKGESVPFFYQLQKEASATCHRGCPEESDREFILPGGASGASARPQGERSEAAGGNGSSGRALAPCGGPLGLSAKEFHRLFVESRETQEKDGEVLALLAKSMEEDGVTHRLKAGKWWNGLELFQLCGVKAANSCASRIRKRLASAGLDLDSRMVPGGNLNEWEYRIAPIEESERVKREQRREEERKGREFKKG